MFQRLAIVALATTVFALGNVAAAEDLKTADEVINRYIAAMGGQEKLDAVRSIRITAKMIMPGGQEMPMTIESVLPDKVRVETVFQGLTSVQAYDGKIGWYIMPFRGDTDPQRMSEDQVQMLRERMDLLGPLVNYRSKGHTVELLGKDDLEGTEVYKLKVTKKGGGVETVYLDAEYFLPIKTEGKMEMMGSTVDYTLTYSDYKKTDDLLFAHSITSSGPMGQATMSIDIIELNVDIPPDQFTMPEASAPTTAPATTQPAPEPNENDSDR